MLSAWNSFSLSASKTCSINVGQDDKQWVCCWHFHYYFQINQLIRGLPFHTFFGAFAIVIRNLNHSDAVFFSSINGEQKWTIEIDIMPLMCLLFFMLVQIVCVIIFRWLYQNLTWTCESNDTGTINFVIDVQIGIPEEEIIHRNWFIFYSIGEI